MDERGIDIVDAFAKAGKDGIGLWGVGHAITLTANPVLPRKLGQTMAKPKCLPT
ncbi:MAG: hypothetical protein ACJA1G_002037 [Qipengyuania sp.]|jgi:hypothetical protein